jgi:3-hydroxy acid dehydrogenase / malonic semialdehyde reductase
MNKIALITGATSGIGRASAMKLADIGFDLILTGRRKEKLDEIQTQITNQTPVRTLCLNFDIRDCKATEQAIDTLDATWKDIDVLVNNAGLAAGMDPINNGNLDDWEAMIDTNVKGLLYITRKVSRLMIERNTGHIINLSSIAAKEVYTNGNVYCATKHAVDALTKGMRLDLLKYNIKVTSIAPGMVNTEFSTVRFKGNKEQADKVYEDLTPLYAEDIADAIVFVVTRPSHVNINDMLIMPTAQANATVTYRKSK